MLGFKQIELSDREILTRFFQYNQNQNSECTFTNLYMWRRCFAVRWATVESHLVVQPNAFESSWILPPYGLDDNDEAFRDAILHVAENYQQNGKKFSVRAITEKEKERMELVLPGRFRYSEEPEIFDYIYDSHALRTLEGRKYSKKRNHLNAFKKLYPDHTFEEITDKNIAEVHQFVEYWCGQRNCDKMLDDSLLCEREAIHDALEAKESLDFTGGLIRIDGNVVAFTLGEMINADTVVIHVEKAFQEFRGLYPAINQEYLKHFWSDAKYVNREEDMGLPGLRKAKESYFPLYLLKKYKGEWLDD